MIRLFRSTRYLTEEVSLGCLSYQLIMKLAFLLLKVAFLQPTLLKVE